MAFSQTCALKPVPKSTTQLHVRIHHSNLSFQTSGTRVCVIYVYQVPFKTRFRIQSIPMYMQINRPIGPKVQYDSKWSKERGGICRGEISDNGYYPSFRSTRRQKTQRSTPSQQRQLWVATRVLSSNVVEVCVLQVQDGALQRAVICINCLLSSQF